MAYFNRLVEARKARGISATEFARKLGIPKSTLAGYEKGTSEPTVERLAHMMELLEVDANWLFQDETRSTQQLTIDEQSLVETYRQLSIPLKKAVKTLAECLLENKEEE